jgi:predicted DNA-binding transcriptional regulator YafY
VDEPSPTARALLALELIQSSPGVSAERIARRLGVSERAVRRYVTILREAGVPVVSERGRYGGYRVGRGARVPPLLFTTDEALGLVMAVLESHGAAAPETPVGAAVAKLARALPAAVADPVERVRQVVARRTDPDPPDPATAAELVRAGEERRRVRVTYRRGPERQVDLEVDPWAVVVRHGRWYLLCFSHAVAERRMLRVDRVLSVELLDASFEPPADLDPWEELEDQLAQGWPYACETEIDAPPDAVRRWLPRSLGRLTALDDDRTLLTGTTEALHWYAGNLTALRAPFRVRGGPELRAEVQRLSGMLAQAVQDQAAE